ncbi:MAG: DoxX family protein [Chlamydiales bacterium]|nr:DoxX family protein [Chlamydiales bacterium]
MKSLGMLLGRWFISAIFLFAASQKLLNWDATSAYMASKGFTMVPLFLAGAMVLEFIGGLALFLGVKTRLAALVLAIFLIPTTVIFHDFWTLPAGEAQALQLTMFLKNCAIFGGLLYILTIGAGNISMDHHRWKKQVDVVEE